MSATPADQYWSFLNEGSLRFQCCCACGHSWLPAREECPACLAVNPSWKEATGRARLFSWVVYHHAFDPEWENRLPYNVAIVELEEGPRLISNIVGVDDPEALHIGMPLRLVIEQEQQRKVPRFRLSQGVQPSR